MSGGTFARCHNCERLVLDGQQCVCEPGRATRCDCTHDGNTQTIGPKCQERIDEAWAKAVGLGGAK